MKSVRFRAPRRRARTAGIAAVVLLAGLLPGARAAAAAQEADAVLRYACQFPAGVEPVKVRVKGTFPATGETGKAIQPRKVSVAVAAPGEALRKAAGSGAAKVTGIANLQTLSTQSGRPTSSEWSGLAIPSTPLGGSGDTTLVASGAVPAVPSAGAGDVVLSAGMLTLRLSTGAEGTAAYGTPIECTPQLGQDTTLVTVPLDGPEQAPPTGTPGSGGGTGTGGTGDRAAAAQENRCSPAPPDEYNPKFMHLFPDPALENAVESPTNTEVACALVDGLSNVNKLKGAAPARGELVAHIKKQGFNRFPTSVSDPGYSQVRHVGKGNFQVTQSVFLTFDFMPTRAKLEITQIGNSNIVNEGPAGARRTRPNLSKAWTEVSMRLFDVHVNGTFMDVGPNCRSSKPILLALEGTSEGDYPYDVEAGGFLTGTADIPAFTGCGVGEDLDRLFTASVSGKGNFVRVVQGPVCFAEFPPTKRLPCPPGDFGYTIEPGGRFRATGGPITFVLRAASAATITCQSTTIAGSFRSGRRIPGMRLGSLTEWTFDRCVGGGSQLTGRTFNVKMDELPIGLEDIGPDPATGGFDKETGVLSGNLFDIPGLSVQETKDGGPGPCSLRLAPAAASPRDIGALYDYSSRAGEFAITSMAGALTELQGCPAVIRGNWSTPPTQRVAFTGIENEMSYSGPLPPLPNE
ncbi:DUF6801 domain-containing protein [Spirillospora sp. NPDC029432]|uniref:DUF6801 domain-containing protein n=1 Tax=Spirillospora sp. NPDC029432 TaxID=3154599 RepID=UPI003452B57E